MPILPYPRAFMSTAVFDPPTTNVGLLLTEGLAVIDWDLDGKEVPE